MSNKAGVIRGFLLIFMYLILAALVLFWIGKAYKLEQRNRELTKQLELCTNQSTELVDLTNKCIENLEASLNREKKIYDRIDKINKSLK
jgi:uncharacterized protein HemX